MGTRVFFLLYRDAHSIVDAFLIHWHCGVMSLPLKSVRFIPFGIANKSRSL